MIDRWGKNKNKVLLLLQLPTLLLPHPFIHLMLELLFLPHTILLQCCLFSFILNILLSQLLPLSTPLLLHSAGHSLHRSVINMSSICCWGLTSPHSCSCFHLPSCWNLSKTPTTPFKYLLLHFILQCICFHIHPAPPGSVLKSVETVRWSLMILCLTIL